MSQKENIGDWILYKNNQLIAVNKPAGVPVQPDKQKDKSLKDLVEIYCKHPVHVIHRIDRPASGVVLFAKNKKAAAHLGEQFKDRKIEKSYLAIVKEKPAKKSDTLSHFLEKHTKGNFSKAHKESVKGSKEAKLNYELIGESDKYNLLKIELQTGRHHQIRSQLSAIGSPIKGDVKYGFRRGNRDRSIHLHAWKINFKHPVTKEKIELTAPLPAEDSLWKFFSDKI